MKNQYICLWKSTANEFAAVFNMDAENQYH